MLGREPDDWQVAFLARQDTPAAGAALLGAARDGDAAAALAQAGVPPQAAQALITAAGARTGAKVGEVLDAARDGYGRALQQAAKMAAESPQALFTPDHLPDQEAYLALADLAAGPDPERRQAFRAAAATHWRDLSDAQLKKRTDALDAVTPELSQGIPFSKWDPAKQAALNPRDRKAFTYAEAHPAPPQGDNWQFVIVRQAYAAGGDDFKLLNPADLSGVLNPAQFKQYMQWPEDVLKNGADGPTAGQINVRRTLRAVREAAAANVGQRLPLSPGAISRGAPQTTPTGDIYDDFAAPPAPNGEAPPQAPDSSRSGAELMPSLPTEADVTGLSSVRLVGGAPQGAELARAFTISQGQPERLHQSEDQGPPADSLASQSGGLLMKAPDTGNAPMRPVQVKGGFIKHLKGLKEFYDKVHEPLEPLGKAWEAFKLARAINKTRHDIKDDDLIRNGDVTIKDDRWVSAVRDEDGKRIGEVHVTSAGWEYQDDWDDTSTHPHVHNDPINWSTVEQVRFNEFKAYLDRSDFGEGFQEVAESLANSISAGLASAGLKMVLGMDAKTSARVREVAFELRLMQLLNARMKVGAAR